MFLVIVANDTDVKDNNKLICVTMIKYEFNALGFCRIQNTDKNPRVHS